MNSNLKPLDQDKLRIFRQKLLLWFQKHGRTFPWRKTRDPYRVLVAEILLQKTNAAKVLPAYRQLVKKYPKVRDLASANVADLRSIIRPLGLLYRARRLKKMARGIIINHGGKLPLTQKELKKLYGVGDYMTNAVMSFAYEQPVPIVDTNIVRVFARVFGTKSPRPRARTDRMLWERIGTAVPAKRARDFNLALLDLAALVCTARDPKCSVCPMIRICLYYYKEL
jgi:A/G-specific adenine glycosylase